MNVCVVCGRVRAGCLAVWVGLEVRVSTCGGGVLRWLGSVLASACSRPGVGFSQEFFLAWSSFLATSSNLIFSTDPQKLCEVVPAVTCCISGEVGAGGAGALLFPGAAAASASPRRGAGEVDGVAISPLPGICNSLLAAVPSSAFDAVGSPRRGGEMHGGVSENTAASGRSFLLCLGCIAGFPELF